MTTHEAAVRNFEEQHPHGDGDRFAGGSADGEQMLRFRDVIKRTGLSRTTIWRKVRDGTFPAPLELGANSVGWRPAWVESWLDARPRRGPASPDAPSDLDTAS